MKLRFGRNVELVSKAGLVEETIVFGGLTWALFGMLTSKDNNIENSISKKATE